MFNSHLFCKQNLLLFVQPRWQPRTYFFNKCVINYHKFRVWSKVLRHNRHKIGHFGDILPSRSWNWKETKANKTN